MSVQENHKIGEPSKKLSFGEALTGTSGLILLGLLFLPWFNWVAGGVVISNESGSRNPQNSLTAWEASPLIAYVLLLLGIVAIGIVLFKFIRPTGFPSAISIFMAGFGFISAGIVLVKIIMPPTEVDLGGIVLKTVDVTPAIGSFLALVAVIGITLGSVLSLCGRVRSTTN
ncbi:MAG: hypothetical protein JSV32_07070 [Dehalococcoidia bacterium]|nr:MAG: hypothetical protein JSV32_07070 [Dehalococcoidia bacterium]